MANADPAGALRITLADGVQALPVLTWLAAQGCSALHFSTMETSLEDIFLDMTGRGLRD